MSSITTWAAFKDLPDSRKVYLMEVTAIEAATPANTTTLYFGTDAMTFSNFYEPAILGVPRLKRNMQETFRGRSLPTWGNIDLGREDSYYINPAGTITFDHLIDGTWLIDDQDITIKFGGEDLPYSEYQTIFIGKVKQIEKYTNTKIMIGIIDLQEVLSQKIVNPNLIAAGANVPDESVGKNKPVALGECNNVKPILIETVTDTYLAHDSSVIACNAITAAYDKGASVAYTDNGDGTLTLTATASGTVTCDVEGAVFESVYRVKIADLAKGLLKTCAGFSDSDIDAAYITSCNTDIPYTVGVYISSKTDVLKAIDSLISGIPMYYTFTRVGKFRIGEFKISGASTQTITDQEIVARSLSGQAHSEIIWRQSINYDKNWTTISESSAGAGLTLAQKERLAETWRQTQSSTASVLTSYPLATDAKTKDTAIISKANADTVAAKWVTLLGAYRRKHSFKVKPLSLGFNLAKRITLEYPRFGLAAGVVYTLIGLTENYKDNQVEMELWG